MVDALNRTFETPVFATFPGRRGSGAELTDFGERLVALYRSMERRARSASAQGLVDIARHTGWNPGELYFRADLRAVQNMPEIGAQAIGNVDGAVGQPAQRPHQHLGDNQIARNVLAHGALVDDDVGVDFFLGRPYHRYDPSGWRFLSSPCSWEPSSPCP